MSIVNDIRRQKLIQLIDKIEYQFEQCSHPYSELKLGKSVEKLDWCNKCGARRFANGQWLLPHWRDILINAIMGESPDLTQADD